MKRLIALLAVFLTLLTTGCNTETLPELLPPEETFPDPSGYVVKGVMKYPDYTLEEDASSLEIRLKAISAFKDVLSVRWSLVNEITYNKTGPLSDKTFHFDADVTYAGLFYSNASTGLFQFLEFYDFETGRIYYPGEVEEFKETLGASCADAMLWGVTTVCNSLTGPYYPVSMVYKNGYLPVGDYTYDYDISSFNILPTYKIVAENGKDVMLDAYTKVNPGDMFTSSVANHGIMVLAVPTVIYLEDGSIDLENSYVLVQDQRGGGSSGHYAVEEDGQTILYSGCTSIEFTFAKLLDKSYIPVTTAEFAGLKPYERSTASISQECSTVKELLDATVSSNYPLAVVNVIAADRFGNETVIGRKLFSGGNKGGVPREFALGELDCLIGFEDSLYNNPNYIIKIEVVPSSGERFIVSEFSVK